MRIEAAQVCPQIPMDGPINKVTFALMFTGEKKHKTNLNTGIQDSKIHGVDTHQIKRKQVQRGGEIITHLYQI